MDAVQGDAIMDNGKFTGSEEMSTDQSTVKRGEVVGLDDIILSEKPLLQEDGHHRNQVEEIKGIEERSAQDYSGSQKQPKEAELDSTETEVVDEDEGIGLDGNELDDINRREELQEDLYPATKDADRTAIGEGGSYVSLLMFLDRNNNSFWESKIIFFHQKVHPGRCTTL